jgi:seryl-tRNA synthetase
MLAPIYIRENADEVRASIARRNMSVDLDRWLKLDGRRSELIPLVEVARSQLKLSVNPLKNSWPAAKAKQGWLATKKSLNTWRQSGSGRRYLNLADTPVAKMQ